MDQLCLPHRAPYSACKLRLARRGTQGRKKPLRNLTCSTDDSEMEQLRHIFQNLMGMKLRPNLNLIAPRVTTVTTRTSKVLFQVALQDRGIKSTSWLQALPPCMTMQRTSVGTQQKLPSMLRTHLYFPYFINIITHPG